jgi:PmbA protein
LRSRPFDGEGLPTAPRAVEAGRLTGWLMDSASARQLGAEPTGHASRGASGPPHVTASNVVLQPGHAAGADGGHRRRRLCDRADRQGVNGVTGDYSRGASGFRIVNGEIAGRWPNSPWPAT